MGSTEYAIIGISKEFGLTEEETLNFIKAVIDVAEDAEIFCIVREKMQYFSFGKILNVLSIIHDGWVVNHSSEEIFYQKIEKEQLRQYLTLELIGWNEVKSDLVFLSSVLALVGISIDEKTLAQEYHTRVADYMEKMKINSDDDLIKIISKGRVSYPILSQELEKRLIPMSKIVAEQIVNNWNNNDIETAEIFNERKQNIN